MQLIYNGTYAQQQGWEFYRKVGDVRAAEMLDLDIGALSGWANKAFKLVPSSLRRFIGGASYCMAIQLHDGQFIVVRTSNPAAVSEALQFEQLEFLRRALVLQEQLKQCLRRKPEPIPQEKDPVLRAFLDDGIIKEE